MAAEQRDLHFKFQARYFRAGNLNAQTRQVWILLHGYGQLAQYFIRKFQVLENDRTFLLAPEGLSRFYLSELTDVGRQDNKVGATWMTRENREMDITNYLMYLNEMAHQELKEFEHIPVTILAFSQGCATACRWVAEGTVNFDRLILWAGIFPPDINFSSAGKLLQNKKTILVVGDQDPFLTPERMVEFDALARKLGIAPEKIVFQGKHEVREDVLLSLV
ncbi:MAG TPA: alpha/beta hydrolase [Cyclobacteriaceae bacterium]|nr:alpha/beta hydrolase [Cyclobacteriaceae bacterium]